MNEAVKVNHLTAGYDGKIIIDDLSLAFPEGKITMMIGPNGCGKSTLLKSIGRFLKPKKGEITINGMNIKKHASKEIARKMAVLPQTSKAPDGLLVSELVSYGRYPYHKGLEGLNQEDHEIVQWAMESVGIAEFADQPVNELSGGQRQRAWIAMALAQKTDILIMDEPTTYLDPAHQMEILKLVQKLNKENGITVLIVIHEMNHAIRFADYIVGMKKGKPVFAGAPEDVITAESLHELYGIHAELGTSKNGYPIVLDYETA